MTITKELSWKDLTAEEQAEVVKSDRLTNPEDFSYCRLLEQLWALNEDQAWLVEVDVEFADQYPNEYFGANDDENAHMSGSCLIPITSEEELEDEDVICRQYLGIDPAHVVDFTVGF